MNIHYIHYIMRFKVISAEIRLSFRFTISSYRFTLISKTLHLDLSKLLPWPIFHFLLRSIAVSHWCMWEIVQWWVWTVWMNMCNDIVHLYRMADTWYSALQESGVVSETEFSSSPVQTRLKKLINVRVTRNVSNDVRNLSSISSRIAGSHK